MSTMVSRAVSLAFAVAAAAALVTGSGAARGQSGAVGELGAGGTARGDISRDAGEEDRIGIDLVEGSALDATLTATFAADIALLAPDDAATTAGFGAASTKTLTGWAVPATGRYHFQIRSARGQQGTYVLTAAAKWAPKSVVTAHSGESIRFGLPAKAVVKATVAAVPAGSWNPSITSLLPDGGAELLGAPVAGVKGMARLKPTAAPVSGMYSLAVGGGAAGAAVQATLFVKVAKRKPVKIDLRSGLSPVSFAADGVGQLLTTYGCVNCHSWAASYASVKPHAPAAVALVASGQMPMGGARMTAADVALFKSWVLAGMNP